MRNQAGSAAASAGTFALISVLGATSASARDEFSIDVAAGASASTNPFLETGDDTSSASAFIEVSPAYVMEDEISVVSLRGVARIEQYTRGRYSSDQSGQIDLDVNRRQSDKLTLRAGANLRSSRGSARDVLRGDLGLPSASGLVQELGDVSFVGRRTRTTTASARVGASYALGVDQSISGDLSVGINRFNDTRLSDYRFSNQEFGYSRALSERTQLQATLGLGQVDYARGKAGDSLIVTPLIGVVQQFSERTRGSLSVGPNYSRITRADGTHDSRTGWALRGNLCNEQARGNICLDAERSSQPTAIGDVRTLTSFRLVANRKLSSRDTVVASVSASRTGDTNRVIGGERNWFVGAATELTRRLDPRLAVFGRASFADIYDRTPSPRADIRGEVGVRYRFGALR